MNLKQMLSKRKKSREQDINILNIMDIFLIMIIFLLQTSAFLRLAIIELVLPSLNKDQGQVQTQDQRQNLVLIVLAVRENGFQLKSLGFKFDPIENSNNQYNYFLLVEQLKTIKQQHPFAEDIIVAPDSKVKYDTIIKVMDRCRETGFPNVSLSG